MKKLKLYPYYYILPALVLLALFTLFPIIYTFYLSFTNYSLYHFEKFDFIGLKNYISILTTSETKTFIMVFIWTIIWSVLSVIFQLTAGLGLALALNKKSLGFKNLYRVLLIIPWAVPSVISILMWGGLLNSDFGAVNMFVKYIGLQPIPWLADPFWAKVSVLAVSLWLGFPFMMALSLSALQSIPSELYEAASIDGAGKNKQFFKITMPLIRAAILPAVITSFAFTFNNFILIYLLTSGGPAVPHSVAGGTDILITYTYKLAFTFARFGLASAYAVLVFILIGTLSYINFNLTKAFKEA